MRKTVFKKKLTWRRASSSSQFPLLIRRISFSRADHWLLAASTRRLAHPLSGTDLTNCGRMHISLRVRSISISLEWDAPARLCLRVNSRRRNAPRREQARRDLRQLLRRWRLMLRAKSQRIPPTVDFLVRPFAGFNPRFHLAIGPRARDIGGGLRREAWDASSERRNSGTATSNSRYPRHPRLPFRTVTAARRGRFADRVLQHKTLRQRTILLTNFLRKSGSLNRVSAAPSTVFGPSTRLDLQLSPERRGLRPDATGEICRSRTRFPV